MADGIAREWMSGITLPRKWLQGQGCRANLGWEFVCVRRRLWAPRPSLPTRNQVLPPQATLKDTALYIYIHTVYIYVYTYKSQKYSCCGVC